jgi:hypothetical protein
MLCQELLFERMKENNGFRLFGKYFDSAQEMTELVEDLWGDTATSELPNPEGRPPAKWWRTVCRTAWKGTFAPPLCALIGAAMERRPGRRAEFEALLPIKIQPKPTGVLDRRALADQIDIRVLRTWYEREPGRKNLDIHVNMAGLDPKEIRWEGDTPSAVFDHLEADPRSDQKIDVILGLVLVAQLDVGDKSPSPQLRAEAAKLKSHALEKLVPALWSQLADDRQTRLRELLGAQAEGESVCRCPYMTA